MRKTSKDKSKFATDEKFNYLSHLFGAILSLYGSVFLLIRASTVMEYITFSVYGFTLIFLFLASAFHHGYRGSRITNKIFLKLDYSAVFGLIAGTFTPICLVLFQDKTGWAVFGVVWFLAAVGISLKCSLKKLSKNISNLLYICMGWAALFLAPGLYNYNLTAFVLMLIGGIWYTVGAIIYAIEKPNFINGKFGFHELWHIFVLLGAFCHFLLIYFFV